MDKLTDALGHSPTKIALFRAIKLGDLLCAVPAFRALRRAFPQAHIALIGLPWASEFVRCYPAYFDEFIPFPGWPGLPEQPLHPERTVAFVQQMQERRWDVVIQMQGNGTLVNAMLGLLGANVLGGYYLPDQPAERWAAQAGFFLPYPTATHEIVRHVQLMDFLGIPSQGYDLDFPLTEIDRVRGQTLLRQLGVLAAPFVCLHAGGISGRRWPASQFAAIADYMASQGYTIVLTGTATEIDSVESVRARMKQPGVSIAGQTTLGELAAILTEAALLISNDTGVAHLAVACKLPSVVIFTSASPAEWGPLDRSLHRVVLETSPTCYEQVLAESQDLLATTLTNLLDNQQEGKPKPSTTAHKTRY